MLEWPGPAEGPVRGCASEGRSQAGCCKAREGRDPPAGLGPLHFGGRRVVGSAGRERSVLRVALGPSCPPLPGAVGVRATLVRAGGEKELFLWLGKGREAVRCRSGWRCLLLLLPPLLPLSLPLSEVDKYRLRCQQCALFTNQRKNTRK